MFPGCWLCGNSTKPCKSLSCKVLCYNSLTFFGEKGVYSETFSISVCYKTVSRKVHRTVHSRFASFYPVLQLVMVKITNKSRSDYGFEIFRILAPANSISITISTKAIKALVLMEYAEPLGSNPAGALVEPVKGGYVVRSCALFSFLCELHILSVLRCG